MICESCKNQTLAAFLLRKLCLQSFALQKKTVTQKSELASTQKPATRSGSIKTKNVFICYHCNKEFRNKIILARHIRTRHGPNSKKSHILDISACDNEFTSTEHKSEAFSEETINIEPVNTEVSENNIIETDNSLEEPRNDSENDMIDKTIQENETKPQEPKRKQKQRITKFTCDDCPESFKNSKKLVEHAVSIHERSPQSVKPFRCTKCDSRFGTSSNLVQHCKYHEGNRINMCTYCGKGFITTSDLLNHEKQHLNKREYTCEFCSKGFNTHKDLRSHKIIKHRDPSTWNYHCTLCDKRFHIKPNYDSHMRRHTGDKRFVCKMCEKHFVTKDELRRHMVSHTNIRDYQCTECGKEYKDKRVLDVHLVKMHNIGSAKVPVRVKKHLCSICPKAFYDKSKLTRHMFTHSGEKPFGCHMCDKKFTDKSYVKHHLRVSHNVDVANNF